MSLTVVAISANNLPIVESSTNHLNVESSSNDLPSVEKSDPWPYVTILLRGNVFKPNVGLH